MMHYHNLFLLVDREPIPVEEVQIIQQNDDCLPGATTDSTSVCTSHDDEYAEPQPLAIDNTNATSWALPVVQALQRRQDKLVCFDHYAKSSRAIQDALSQTRAAAAALQQTARAQCLVAQDCCAADNGIPPSLTSIVSMSLALEAEQQQQRHAAANAQFLSSMRKVVMMENHIARLEALEARMRIYSLGGNTM